MTSVEMGVWPDGGGLLEPLDEGQAGGWQTEIPNHGSVTVVDKATGEPVASQSMSWACVDHAPSGACEDPVQDVWDFNFTVQRPSVFDVCAEIDAGFGFLGWSRCETYATQLRQLFRFGRGSERGGKLVVPLTASPALQGQPVTVTATWFRAKLVSAFGHRSVIGSHCISCQRLDWKQLGSDTQTMTLGRRQMLGFQRGLTLNTKVELSLDFPEISGAFDPAFAVPVPDPGQWSEAGGCDLDLHGKVKLRWKHLPADLEGPRLKDKSVACSSTVLQKGDASYVYPVAQ